MNNCKKTFDNIRQAKAFTKGLGLLTFEAYRPAPGGRIEAEWRQLALTVYLAPRAPFSKGRDYPVIKETRHAYIIKDDCDKFAKVNRHTMMGYNSQFMVA